MNKYTNPKLLALILTYTIQKQTCFAYQQNNIKQYVKILQTQANNLSQQDIKELVQDLFIQSVTDIILGHTERAYESLSNSLKLDPANACIHYKLSQVLHKLPYLENKKKFITDSYTHIYAAIELSPQTQHYYYTALNMHKNSGQYHEACTLYEEMFKNFTPTPHDLWDLAHLYIEIKDYRQAIRTYSQLEQMIGVNQQIIKEKHAAFLALNEMEMAITDAMKVASQFPENEEYILNLIELLFQNKQPGLAIQYLKSHFAIYPMHINTLRRLVSELINLEKYEEAFTYIKALFATTLVPIHEKLEILHMYTNSANLDKPNHTELLNILLTTHPNSHDIIKEKLS